MYKFSKKSLERLETCDQGIQIVMQSAIKLVDFSVVCGERTTAEQLKLFKQGRKQKKDGSFKVIDKSKIVTNIDGINKVSKHNYSPSRAIDIIPYPTGYKSIEQFHYLAGVVLTISAWFGIPFEWGGNWKSIKDYPHFELKEKIK
jgi:peptidoglycan L-alanyl-D-glutamate endopeptidase CwlK